MIIKNAIQSVVLYVYRYTIVYEKGLLFLLSCCFLRANQREKVFLCQSNGHCERKYT